MRASVRDVVMSKRTLDPVQKRERSAAALHTLRCCRVNGRAASSRVGFTTSRQQLLHGLIAEGVRQTMKTWTLFSRERRRRAPPIRRERLCLKTLFSFTPGFSPVEKHTFSRNRFNGFV